jgi:hypothetical protein
MPESHPHPHAAAGLASTSSRRSLSLGSSISQSFRQMDSTDDPFARAQSEHEHRDDDEENLRWAALQKLPTYDRMRQGILRRALDDQEQQSGDGDVEVVDIHKLAAGDGGRALLERLFQEDSDPFLRRLRDRIDMVGIELPTVEVRYEQLTVKADVVAAGRALPTLWNAATNFLQVSAMHQLSVFFCLLVILLAN